MNYAIWFLEKEFHVGLITDQFPAMKFMNLYNKYNIDRYNKETNPKKGSNMMG